MSEKFSYTFSGDANEMDSQEYEDFLKGHEVYHEFIRKSLKENEKLIKRKITETLEDLPMPEEESNEFAGLFVHGGHYELKIEEVELPFSTFRKFSKKKYPVHFFYHENSEFSNEAIEYLQKEYPPINVINIHKLDSFHLYNDFLVYEAFQSLPEEAERVVTFQTDGFFKRSGWEDWINEHDPDYVGAPWVVPEELRKFKNGEYILVGNGGFSFRKKSKILEASKHLTKDFIKQMEASRNGVKMPEDFALSLIGFREGIFKNIDHDLAKDFSCEPYNDIYGFGFHRFI